MRAFHYRLQRVLDARDAIVSRCEVLLAESEQELARRRREQADCDAAVQAAASQETRVGQDALPVRECLTQRAWFHHLADRLDHAMRAAVKQGAKVGQRREALRKALIDRKVMESLSDRERRAWLAQVLMLEQKALDEQGSTIYLRRMSSRKDAEARLKALSEDGT